MLRYRKLWMGIAGLVILLILAGSFIKPDLVTVVPNESQLNREESDLHIQSQSNRQKEEKDYKANGHDSVDHLDSTRNDPAGSE